MRASIGRVTFYFWAWYTASLIIGCGDAGSVKPIKNLVPVQGMVTFNGQPLEQGIIAFAPEDPRGQSATGKIKNGRFIMETTESARGVVVGKYKVRVISDKPLDPPSDADKQIPLSKRKMPEPVSVIPKKYNKFEASGLEADVSAKPADLKFELKAE